MGAGQSGPSCPSSWRISGWSGASPGGHSVSMDGTPVSNSKQRQSWAGSPCNQRELLQPEGSRSGTRLFYPVPGHRQKLEDQAKPFTDRYGELERLRQSMRVTPTTPNPRGSLSTPSHFGSQAQTPIQGNSWGSQGHPEPQCERGQPSGWDLRVGTQLSPGEGARESFVWIS